MVCVVADEGGAGEEEEEYVVELQETVLVSEVEGEAVSVQGFSSDELVIQDAVEDVVAEYVHCDDDEGVAVETCVMSLEEEEEEEEDGVAMAEMTEDVLVTEERDAEHDSDGCGDYLMISCNSPNHSIICRLVPFVQFIVPNVVCYFSNST